MNKKIIFTIIILLTIAATAMFFLKNYVIVKKTEYAAKLAKTEQFRSNLYNANLKLKKYKEEEERKEEYTHPIDKELQECMKKDNYTTAAMNSCTYEAADKWEAEIEKSLKDLKSVLPKDEYKQVEISQQKWLEWKKEEYKMIGFIYSHMLGTIYTTIQASHIEGIIENRARDLNAHYYNLKEGAIPND